MTYDAEQIRELLPRYLAGELNDTDRQQVEQALVVNQELSFELNELRDLKEYYRDLAQEIPPPADDLFSRIQKNVQAEKQWDDEVGVGAKIVAALRAFFGPPSLAWGIVAVQCLLIIALLVTPDREVYFQTLSDSHFVATEGIMINLVFTEEVSEVDMRFLLLQVRADIVAGPSAQGRYVISVPASQKLAETLSILRASPVIKFAEPAL
ncbi:MAG: zf-HC2 domain-containing protein [Proteobacteria bacterium]|nr:zf-HC2 domain-containing protein [Pseudomonadota bacterium]MBU1716694.1 zf-HC2 domain-containing protein [Pseudomonadota bacterium]